MKIVNEVKGVLGRVRVVGWVIIFAILILFVELNLIATTAWGTLDIQTQLTIVGITMTIVIALGFSRLGTDGFLKVKKRRRKKK